MRDQPHLDWPFFDEGHGVFAAELDGWAREHVAHLEIDTPVAPMLVGDNEVVFDFEAGEPRANLGKRHLS